MKKLGRLIASGFASVALAVCGLAAPAAAHSPQGGTGTNNSGIRVTDALATGQPVIHKRGDGVRPPAELGNPSEWGVVKIEIKNSTARLLGNSCKIVTHGKWCYGWDSAGSDGKKCYSNYMANVKHKSTVRVQNVDYTSGWVAKDGISYAKVTIGLAYTCYAYYSNA